VPTDCEKALSKLLAECRSLASQARIAARRAAHPADLLDGLRKARAHVELAIDTLDPAGADGPGGSSLSGRVAGLAGRLARGGARGNGRLADSIASLRRSRRESGRDGFSGSSTCISLPDLLGFLHVQGKSGTLRVRLERESLTIAFRKGDLVLASSDNSPVGCRLGEILVEQGALAREELQSFLVYHCSKSGKLGRALEVRDLVTEEDLRAALDRQMHALFSRLFQARDADFSFREDEIPPETGDPGLNVIQLLLEGARVHDENQREQGTQDPVVDRDALPPLPRRSLRRIRRSRPPAKE
jgi:hypothetical protein